VHQLDRKAVSPETIDIDQAHYARGMIGSPEEGPGEPPTVGEGVGKVGKSEF
jgi:hypothetical protein